jgi:hypothetical protein
MLSVFWDSQGVLLAHFKKLRDSIHRKHPSQLARGILLHHDNVRPHTGQATQERIQEPQWERLEHLPYSPDLAASDFHLFGPLKKSPWWQMFCWWQRGWNGGAEVAETTVKRLLCCEFQHTGKAMGQVYQCWWRICRKINVFPGLNITCLAFYIHLWCIYWLFIVIK